MAAGNLSSGSAPASAAVSPFRVPVQLPRSNSRTKSPPLAFEKTPNDSLIPLISPPTLHDTDPFDAMLTNGPPDSNAHYQTVIDKQSTAIEALHTAFAAERDAWASERKQLYQRVANLERLLRAQNGHSPARSPVISPNATVGSPPMQARAVSSNARLASIAEDENLRPLSERREFAPRSISVPTIDTISHRDSIDFSYNAAAQLDEIHGSSPSSTKRLSPPAESITFDAGHTPLKTAFRPPTPPPKNMTLTGVEDTPTRNNTHINTLLTQGSDEEIDVALKGPLNMPELPGKPSLSNFTEEMLFKKLEHIAQNPAENKPTIFSIPSPGLAIAEEDGIDAGLSPQSGIAAFTEAPLAPVATRTDHNFQSITSSQTLATDNISPGNGSASHESDAEKKFAEGGIRLKKKPSTNFGAPFGSLSFGGLRKLS